MRLPHVNSFFWIGLVLIAIAIYSVVKGPVFQFDAGVPNEAHEPLIYLGVGIMMLVNGLVHPPPLTDDKLKAKAVPAKPTGSSGKESATRTSAPKQEDGKDSGTVPSV
jgi:hypothetical protein